MAPRFSRLHRLTPQPRLGGLDDAGVVELDPVGGAADVGRAQVEVLAGAVVDADPVEEAVRQRLDHLARDPLPVAAGYAEFQPLSTTDRNRKDLMVNGRLAVFLAEVAE